MRVLITYGSKYGGTAGIAEAIALPLRADGHEVDVLLSTNRVRADAYDVVIVGGGLYANRWHKDARRFVKRNRAQLADRPVWMFSSGPLDDSAAEGSIPPTNQVAGMMQDVGARAHATFGGRLQPDVKGFPAAAMAREQAGDWRDMDQVSAWAAGISAELTELVTNRS